MSSMGRPTFVRRRFCVQVPHGYVGKSSRVLFVRKGKKRMPIFEIVYYFPAHISLSPWAGWHFFQHTCIQYTHYFHQSSSQTRDLRHNQCIPFLYSFNSTPSFLSLADRVPETVSSTHTSIWKSLCLAKRFISNRWFSTVCLSVETRIYAYIIAASLSFFIERNANLIYIIRGGKFHRILLRFSKKN